MMKAESSSGTSPTILSSYPRNPPFRDGRAGVGASRGPPASHRPHISVSGFRQQLDSVLRYRGRTVPRTVCQAADHPFRPSRRGALPTARDSSTM